MTLPGSKIRASMNWHWGAAALANTIRRSDSRKLSNVARFHVIRKQITCSVVSPGKPSNCRDSVRGARGLI